MTFTELITKIAKGDKLSPMEIEELKLISGDIDSVRTIGKTWQRIQDKKFNTEFLELPFVPIYSQVLEQDLSELTIKIPAQYKHLLIMGQGRINGSGGQPDVFSLAQFNGDTGASSYVWGHVIHAGTVVSAGQDLAADSIPFIYMAADGFAAGPAGNAFMFIPHYNSGYYKNIMIVGSVYGTNTNSAVRQGNWLSTDPITSIRIYPDPAYANAKLETGSLISIYGIL